MQHAHLASGGTDHEKRTARSDKGTCQKRLHNHNASKGTSPIKTVKAYVRSRLAALAITLPRNIPAARRKTAFGTIGIIGVSSQLERVHRGDPVELAVSKNGGLGRFELQSTSHSFS